MQHDNPHMKITCLDFEGVLIPEIWVGLAEQTGIEELRLTTRDIVDYDNLMRYRLKICDNKNLRIKDIHAVVSKMNPLDGAIEFLHWLRTECEVIILSDTFREFVSPLLNKLSQPTIFCHTLKIDQSGRITDYLLRQQDQKRKAVNALKDLNFLVLAAGDSYNDISMLQNAHHGIFFRPTQEITNEHPSFPVTHQYAELKLELQKHLNDQ
jgi:phosphoserine/homoserine phosphotransferase